MKKVILMLVIALTAMSFTVDKGGINKIGITRTVFEPTMPNSYNCYCVAGNAQWNGDAVCCHVTCTIYSSAGLTTGGFDFYVCSNSPSAFVDNPPTSSPSPYAIDLTVTLDAQTTHSADEVNYYNNFKNNGSYNVSEDQTFTDAQGNITVYKAGTYQITNSKLQVKVSRVNL